MNIIHVHQMCGGHGMYYEGWMDYIVCTLREVWISSVSSSLSLVAEDDLVGGSRPVRARVADKSYL